MKHSKVVSGATASVAIALVMGVLAPGVAYADDASGELAAVSAVEAESEVNTESGELAQAATAEEGGVRASLPSKATPGSGIDWGFNPADHPRPGDADNSWGHFGEYVGSTYWSFQWFMNYTDKDQIITGYDLAQKGGFGKMYMENCQLPIVIPAGGSASCEIAYDMDYRDADRITVDIMWVGDGGVEFDNTLKIRAEDNRPTEPTNPGGGSSKPPVAKGPFWDVPATHKFVKPITWMKNTGLTTGNADGSYRPAQGLTREAMAAFLYRQAGKPAFTMPKNGFSDVRPGHKFYREIMWMKATGLSTGYADGTYRPSATLTREAMAAFMYRQDGSPKSFSTGHLKEFRDVQRGHKFFTAIKWMQFDGVTTGYADGTFRPKDPVTREAMAAFLYRQAGSPKL